MTHTDGGPAIDYIDMLLSYEVLVKYLPYEPEVRGRCAVPYWYVVQWYW